MIKRVCPICDQEMKGKYYCRRCHSWVKPYEYDRNFYLNERHVDEEMEKNCEYHRGGRAELGTAGTGGAYRYRWKKQSQSSFGKVVAGMGVLLALGAMGVAAYLEEGSAGGSALEVTQEIYEEDFGEEDDILLTEEEMETYRALGEPCTIMDHFPVRWEGVEDAILMTAGYWSGTFTQDHLETNMRYPQDGETLFSHTEYVENEEEGEYGDYQAMLSWDSVTGQVHSVSFMGNDTEFLKRAIRQVSLALMETPDEDMAGDMALDVTEYVEAHEQEEAYRTKGYGDITVYMMKTDGDYLVELYYYEGLGGEL